MRVILGFPTSRPVLLLAIGLTICSGVAADTFVYAGRLEDNGRQAHGAYDLQLTAWNAAQHGTPLTSPMTFPDVDVRDGRFRLEFDLPQSSREQVWIEVGVREASAADPFSAIPGRAKALASVLIGRCWSATGDTGSSPDANFLGTIDAQPLVLRVHNAPGLRIEPSTILAGGMPITSNVIAGSRGNLVEAGAQGTTIAGGGNVAAINWVSDHYGTVGGGNSNEAGNGAAPSFDDAAFATVGGGRGNRALGLNSTVAGGEANHAAGSHSVIAGGNLNTVTGLAGAVLGGYQNRSDGAASTIAGGENNHASGASSAVLGGYLNRANGASSNIGGGERNRASGVASAVLGGLQNTASGVTSVVTGGYQNCAGGARSWAGGVLAQVRVGAGSGDAGTGCALVAASGDNDGDEGTFIWTDSTFAPLTSTGPNQFLVRANGGIGVNSAAIPDGIDLMLVNRTPSNGNVDLYLRNDAQPRGINIAMLPTEGAAEMRIAQYDGMNFDDRIALRSNGDLEITANAFKPGGGAWAASSDRRLKRDVQALQGALDRLLGLHGVSFHYRDPDAARRPAGAHIGLIAQDVAKVFPTWVNTDADGYLTVAAQGFEALAVEALRDLRREKDEEINALLGDNAALRKDNATLHQRLDAIEQALRRGHADGAR